MLMVMMMIIIIIINIEMTANYCTVHDVVKECI